MRDCTEPNASDAAGHETAWLKQPRACTPQCSWASVWQLLLGGNWCVCLCGVCVCVCPVNLMKAWVYLHVPTLLSCFRMPFHMIGNKWLQSQISLPLLPVNHCGMAQKRPSLCYYKVESAQFPCYFSHHLQEDHVDTLSSKLTMRENEQCG